MSLPIGSVVTDVTLESLSATNQSNTPITFGQVFKVGDMLQGESLVGRIGKVDQPLQYEVKTTHADGSVRHAIISMVLPSLAAKTLPVMQLVKVASSASAVGASTSATASVSATIAGIKYIATVDNTHLGNAVWLSGNVAQEKQFNLPLTATDGTVHPHLYARFALRDYAAIRNVRVDLTVENNWAYVKGPQNFVYDLEIQVNGIVVYSQASLNHYHHARYRKLYWTGESPRINVKSNSAYLMASKAVPNYDTSAQPSESHLKTLSAMSLSSGPLQIGAATAYMPTTGAHADIGVLPQWQASLILSMDSRARDATMVTGNGSGSFSMHYRNQITDRPVSLADFPYMTIDGRSTDTGNPLTGKQEAFPGLVGNTSTPYTADTAHHPSLAYLPYLLTGDYYYLEELQFWANYNIFKSNPGYRGNIAGWVISEQLRGQAWALRTLAQAAYITPDSDSLKSVFIKLMNSNLDWYNNAYTNNSIRSAVTPGDSDYNPAKMGNDLGAIVNGFTVAYDGGIGTAPWMDDFFTSSIGYAADLGFTKAIPLLAWKAKFPVGRMTAPGVCWITGAPYALYLRATPNGPFYKTLADCYKAELGEKFMALPCASPAMAQAWNSVGYPSNQYPSDRTIAGDMSNIAFGEMGYPSNMQPALAYCAEYDLPDARRAWDLFMSRSVKCDYSNGAQFNIVPRNYVAKPVAPYVDTDPRTWKEIGKEGTTVTVPANTTVRYGASGLYTKEVVMSGQVLISNATFDEDPAPNIPKVLQQLIPTATPPIEEPKMTFKVSVALAFANQTLPAGSEAAVTSTIVEILDLTGAVVASSSSVYEFSGINAGEYVVRASGIDSKGAVMGVPYSQGFTIVDTPPVDTPPVDTPPVEPTPQPVDVSLPSGVTVSYVKE